MMIQVTSETSQTIGDTEYCYTELSTDKKSILVTVAKGSDAHVRVVVQNAAHRVWRGAGKRFATLADAIANYKSDDVKAMLETLVTV